MKFPSTIIQCPCCGAPCEPLESTSHIVIEEERICDECEYEFVINSLGTIIDDGGIDGTSPLSHLG